MAGGGTPQHRFARLRPALGETIIGAGVLVLAIVMVWQTLSIPVSPIYAQVGPTETRARQDHDVVVTTAPFATTARPIIDGRTDGFCKIIVDRNSHRILGCHIVGERAVELAQVAAVAIAAEMTVEQLARLPLSFPTYTNVLGRAVFDAPPAGHTRLLGRSRRNCSQYVMPES